MNKYGMLMAIGMTMLSPGCKGQSETATINVGDKFPTITSESLARTTVTLPVAAKGNITLITIAYVQEAQAQIDSWAEPILKDYFGKPGFAYYELPVLQKIYKQIGASSYIDGGMRGGIDPKRHPNVVTVYADREPFFQWFGTDKTLAYILLMDAEGTVLWKDQGFATPTKVEGLRRRIAAERAKLKL